VAAPLAAEIAIAVSAAPSETENEIPDTKAIA
jgi:hypothetical protein